MMNEKSRQSIIRGCLAGGAIGDALGYPVEFMSWPAIQRAHGEAGIQAFAPDKRTGLALISDDTQMTLYTAVGLLNHDTALRLRGRADPPAAFIWKAYRDWYFCQRDGRAPDGNTAWISGCAAMCARRAPGNTCLQALRMGEPGLIDEPVNNSCGCGGIMRVAPAALYFSDPADVLEGDRLAADAAALTHGHSLGWISSAAFAHIVGRAAWGGCRYGDGLMGIVRESMEAIEALFPDNGFVQEQQELVDKAVWLAGRGGDDARALHSIGGGWTGHDALADAVYCCLRYPDDFSRAVTAAVNHDGDSDSTGAIVGNIMGAWLGIGAIEPRWLEALEARDEIFALADDLAAGCPDAPDAAWRERYDLRG